MSFSQLHILLLYIDFIFSSLKSNGPGESLSLSLSLFLHKKHQSLSTHKHQSPLSAPIHKYQNPFLSTHKHRSLPPALIYKCIKFTIMHSLSLFADLSVCFCASLCWFVCVGVFVCIKGRRRWWGRAKVWVCFANGEEREKMSKIMKLIKYYNAKL